jgi:hypothetical protein
MTISNEQRAHDLALLAVEIEANRKIASQLNGSTDPRNTAEFDFYGAYYDLYMQILNEVNKDFPTINS